jgi:Family of unknown function (DUF5372)
VSTTPQGNDEAQTFQVTHPFHPLRGKTLALVTYRHNWGEDRVYYHDEGGRLHALPLAWTNLAPVDPFVSLAAGRAAFRVSDLLELSRRLAALAPTPEEECDAHDPVAR